MPELDQLGEYDFEATLVQEVPRRFVLLTGAGRSGTSTMSGTFNYLGLHVPRPFLGANKSNPRGFFESRWAIQFHRKILDQANVDMFDARPDAQAKVAEHVHSRHGDLIRDWLGEQVGHAPQVAVKDPRSAWMPTLWAQAAESLQFQPGFVMMLRHPAEVVGSRATYYAKGDDADVRRYQVTNVARWVNANLMSEHDTRGKPRAFVRYDDLVSDWRPVVQAVGEQLDLTYNVDLTDMRPHAVDTFIDPELNRHPLNWADLEIPEGLQVVAEATWRECSALADDPGNADAQRRLDEIAVDYNRLFLDAAAISHDVAAAGARAARKKAVRETKAQLVDEQPASKPPPASQVARLPRVRKVATQIRAKVSKLRRGR